MIALSWAGSFLLGALFGPPLLRAVGRMVPRYIVAIEFEAVLGGDGWNGKRYVFYFRSKNNIRGNEDHAKRFWTERGAKAIAAEMELSGAECNLNGFKLIEIRVLKVKPL